MRMQLLARIHFYRRRRSQKRCKKSGRISRTPKMEADDCFRNIALFPKIFFLHSSPSLPASEPTERREFFLPRGNLFRRTPARTISVVSLVRNCRKFLFENKVFPDWTSVLLEYAYNSRRAISDDLGKIFVRKVTRNITER